MRKRKRNKYFGRNGLCAYCKRTMEDSKNPRHPLLPTRDHVIPKSLGGNYITWCCQTCNSMKANMPIQEWEEFMFHNPNWWKYPEIARKIQGQMMKIKNNPDFYNEYIEVGLSESLF